MTIRDVAHKSAQRAMPVLTMCQECGSTDNLERHHPNYNQPSIFQVLCQKCHIKADQRDGTRRTRKTKNCKVCGKEFTPSHSKNNNTCSKECLSEIGRINANKRWHGQRIGNKECHELLEANPIE